MDLIKGLAAQRNRLYQSHAALSDALAAGEIDVAWGLIAARAIELGAKGAPVAYTLSDPQMAEGNTLSIGRDTSKRMRQRCSWMSCCRQKCSRRPIGGSLAHFRQPQGNVFDSRHSHRGPLHLSCPVA
jgi:hypothetical protein